MRRLVVFLALPALLGALPRAPVNGPARTRASHPHPAYAAAAVNHSISAGPLDERASGPVALRAQILLDRAGFSVGEIDGRIGSNTRHAIAGFRTQQGLPAGEGADDAIWRALDRNSSPVLIPYTIAADDLKGPFVKVPPDMMAQAKLDYLGYASPLDKLSEKFHIRPALLQQLNKCGKCNREGQQIMVPNVRASIRAQAARIVVSMSSNTLTVLDAAGKIVAQYPCSSGSEHDPLPIGEWKIVGVARNPQFHYNPNLFWDANATDAKTTIAPGPRNPVGLVWIDLSKEHYGIHGTPAPSRIGYSQSHGCIRLTNWDALELASMVKPGTPASLVE
jgi:lipoprotein-anchoring transpeptidase ErfK/SrfK